MRILIFVSFLFLLNGCAINWKTISTQELTEKIKDGYNVNSRDDNGNTPLLLAAQEADSQIVEILLKNGAYINSVNEYGHSALILAAANNTDLGVFLVLLKYGANVNMKNSSGENAIYYAMRYNTKEVAQTLLQNGADINIRTNVGRTPIGESIFFNQRTLPAISYSKNRINTCDSLLMDIYFRKTGYKTSIDKWKSTKCPAYHGWFGMLEKDLVLQKGIPTQIYVVDENTKMYVYKKINTNYIPLSSYSNSSLKASIDYQYYNNWEYKGTSDTSTQYMGGYTIAIESIETVVIEDGIVLEIKTQSNTNTF